MFTGGRDQGFIPVLFTGRYEKRTDHGKRASTYIHTHMYITIQYITGIFTNWLNLIF